MLKYSEIKTLLYENQKNIQNTNKSFQKMDWSKSQERKHLQQETGKEKGFIK